MNAKSCNQLAFCGDADYGRGENLTNHAEESKQDRVIVSKSNVTFLLATRALKTATANTKE